LPPGSQWRGAAPQVRHADHYKAIIMNSIIYIVGVIVIIMVILSFIGFR
jgi:hypothetical protein